MSENISTKRQEFLDKFQRDHSVVIHCTTEEQGETIASMLNKHYKCGRYQSWNHMYPGCTCYQYSGCYSHLEHFVKKGYDIVTFDEAVSFLTTDEVIVSAEEPYYNEILEVIKKGEDKKVADIIAKRLKPVRDRLILTVNMLYEQIKDVTVSPELFDFMFDIDRVADHYICVRLNGGETVSVDANVDSNIDGNYQIVLGG